ncbi:tRNA (adenosine(37)-N6)-dimethylallyltransferase MiaA [Roseateles terrae]|uniref:tRNA dimethylallyltransferase n=1 Tax=Roseateles terrae TaxID=431060 RepID=A0ABR6GRI6_9BURK|nr:tRNA (adenosine(37)-N6)-dimethylallyltransferase MiaA [Roseateles terrae]MBB3193753.1 tRNA dimethylallyltransferase [Roseateles terrae]OWQ89096.1 tRNA (adenosine(37)-N6)-dimethylallyltransferase MiaA [Roseateles terrae]
MSVRPLCLAGPTGCGKTAAALALARREKVEIISVDSALVYRGMDIGTAKPSAAELAEVPHHLIDLLEPTQAYSAAQFVRDTLALVPQIQARGARPLLVGGTMLYFKALFDGLSELPQADAALRADLDARADREGWPALHAWLATLDPATAARLAPMDSQRIQRALEVCLLTGEPMSALYQRQRSAGVDWPLISLEPGDQARAWLHQRLGERFAQMIRDGLVDEVRSLRARGDLTPDLPSMRCVGYRQAWELLDEAQALGRPEPDLAALQERGTAATRQLAKRQITWLRSMPARRVVQAEQPDALTAVMTLIEDLR